MMEKVEREQLFLKNCSALPCQATFHYDPTWSDSMNKLSVTPFLHLKQHT